MNLYRNTVTGEIRELDPELIASWQAVGNPKASQWEPYSPPSPQPSEPQPDWATFKTQAIESVALNTILLEAYSSAPVAAGALASALLRAEQGNIADFCSTWAAICAAVPSSLTSIPGFQQVASACNLPLEFINSLDPSNP